MHICGSLVLGLATLICNPYSPAIAGHTDSSKLNVLIVPVQGKTHFFVLQTIAKEMVSRGHAVYVVLGSKFGPHVQTQVQESGVKILWYQQVSHNLTAESVEDIIAQNTMQQPNTHEKVFFEAVKYLPLECEDMLNDGELHHQMKTITFDIALLDAFVACPCGVLLPHRYSIPFVAVDFAHLPWRMGDATLPSFHPLIPKFYTDEMTFWQRLDNFVSSLLFYNSLWYISNDAAMVKKYAPGKKSVHDIVRKKAKLFIVGRNFITNWPTASLPHIISVPGLTYSDPKPLPADLQQIMQSSKAVIIFSFGSIGGKIPVKHMKKLLNAFKALDRTVIMSYSGNTQQFEPLPRNLHIFKWIPQNDLLGHSNTKVFITHGGHNGHMEAIYHGVPMITIPLFAEQHHNAFRMESHGLGLTLDLFYFTSMDIIGTVNEILSNGKYAEAARRRSRMLKDLPQKPPPELISDWIEYVANNGADHLRSAAIDMPMYQKFLLDVIGFILLAFILLILVFYKCCTMIFRCIFKSRTDIKVKIN